MNTINEIVEFTHVIKKSVFTCTLIPVNSIEEVWNNQERNNSYYEWVSKSW